MILTRSHIIVSISSYHEIDPSSLNALKAHMEIILQRNEVSVQNVIARIRDKMQA